MSSRVRITPLDGLGQIGGAKWLVQEIGQRDQVAIDFGANMADEARLLGNRLRPRDSHGLDDLLALGLLPSLGNTYRPDAILDLRRLENARDLRLTDLLLSHAHHDHSGKLFALDRSIRLHCSAITAAMLRADGVCSTGLSSETTHMVERLPHPTESGILHKPRGGEVLSRPLLLVDGEPTEALREMWREAGSDEGLGRSDGRCGSMTFTSHRVDHSCYGALGFILDASGTKVAFTGDLRRHGANGEHTDAFVRRMARTAIDALVVEGTRVGREDDALVSEADCAESLRKAVKGAGRSLVIASVGHRHIERLGNMVAAARASRRAVVVPARLFLLLEAVAAADPSQGLSGMEGIAVFDPPLVTRSPWHRDLRERRPDLLVGPERIRKEPNRHVVLWGFGRTMDLVDLEPHGATFVWAASAAYTDEARGRQSVLGEWVRLYGMDAHGIRFANGGCEYDPLFNAGGHMSEPEIESLIKRVKPGLLIPCHTEHAERFERMAPKGTQLVLPREGKAILIG